MSIKNAKLLILKLLTIINEVPNNESWKQYTDKEKQDYIKLLMWYSKDVAEPLSDMIEKYKTIYEPDGIKLLNLFNITKDYFTGKDCNKGRSRDMLALLLDYKREHDNRPWYLKLFKPYRLPIIERSRNEV